MDTTYLDTASGGLRLNSLGRGCYRYDNFISKLDSNGNPIWANTIASKSGNVTGYFDLSTSGEVYFLGSFKDSIYFNNLPMQIDNNRAFGQLICKMDDNGNLQAARIYSSDTNLIANNIVLSKNEEIYIVGRFNEKSQIEFDTSVFRLRGNLISDNFILKMNSSLRAQWLKSFGGMEKESSLPATTDNYGGFYSSGYFGDTVDFNTGSGVDLRVSRGESDLYIHKLSPCTIKKSSQSDTICARDSLVIGQNVYIETGNYIDAYESTTGCDSLVTTALFVRQLKTDTAKFTICEGHSIQVNGQTYKSEGVFDTIYSFAASCDSIFVVVLKVDSVSFTNNTFTICEGDSISIATNTYFTSGNYQDTLQAANGCDSIISTELIVNPRKFSNQNAAICEGDSFLVGNTVYNTSGTYTDTLVSKLGCDSIVTTALLVKPIRRTNQTIRLCFGESLEVGNTTYSKSGTYIDTLEAANDCDSIVTTNLTIDEQIETSQSFILCAADSALVGNSIYKSSGTFLDTLTAASGCDSLVSTTIEKIDLSFDSARINLLHVNQELAKYQWLDCLNNLSPIIGETNQSISIDSRGVFAVEVSFKNCKDTSSCITVRFEEVNAESFLIYPNPTNRFAIMVFPTDGKLKIYDSAGRLVFNQGFQAGKNQLDVDFLSSGFYTLKFESKFGAIFEKLVVSR